MADQFRIESAEVRAVADRLSGLSGRMTGHVSGLGAQVASAGAPWGSDTTGERFAGVANGFVAHMQQSLQAMAARAETVQRHADRLAAHARVFEQADQA